MSWIDSVIDLFQPDRKHMWITPPKIRISASNSQVSPAKLVEKKHAKQAKTSDFSATEMVV